MAPDDWPYSALKLLETTMNSLIASTEKPPRCPATESSSLLSPSIRNVLLRVSWPADEMPLPAVLVTPGVSWASVAKLRPAIGSSSISLVVMVVPSADRVVSTSGNSAVTVTASCSAATRNVSVSVISCATFNTRSDRTSRPKPASSAAIS